MFWVATRYTDVFNEVHTLADRPADFAIYRPIGAAFPNNPTQTAPWCDRVRHDGLSPSLAPLSRELGPGPSLRTLLRLQFNAKTPDFQAGLFPRPGILSSILANRARNTRRPASVRYPREDWGTTICDTQQTCLAVRLGAQLALKDSMVHGFCNSHQVSISPRSSSMREPRYPLSRVALDFTLQHRSNKHRLRLAKAGCLVECSLTLFVPGLVISEAMRA
ncbi:hypothetical protein Bca101_041343 [Brassica carinata]